MKKYSTNYPLIFGIFFLIVGIDAGQIPIILLFGVVPIVASVLMKWSDHKAKKQGKETRTEKANRIYQETMKASGKNAQVKEIGDQTIILRDSFVKAALVDTIYFTDYSSKKKQDKKFLENFYSAAMAGEYTLEQYTVTKTELVPGNDSPDYYYVYSDGIRFEINNSAFKKCSIGDCVVGVTVRGMPIHSVLILINAEHEQPLVAWQNHFYQLKYRMPKC